MSDDRTFLVPPVRVLLAVADPGAKSAIGTALGRSALAQVDLADGGDAVTAAGLAQYDLAILDPEAVIGPNAAPLIESLVAGAAARNTAAETRIDLESRRLAHQKFTSIFDASPAPMFMADAASGTVIDVNPAFAELTGYERDGLRGRALTDIDMWAAEHRWRLISRLAGGPAMRNVDMRLRHRGGSIREILLATERIKNPETGDLCVGIVTDVTELRVLERRVQQAQKMEALGQLAGGVAHDFNNLLMVISGFAELIADHEELPTDVERDTQEILKATRTAGALTRQLLTFSRRSSIEPTVLNINSVVEEMEGMLKRLLGDAVALRTNLAADLETVRVDSGQIEQIVMNLAVNARDAMASGGQLTVETANIVLDAEWAERHPGGKPGRFAMLAVADTGTGMSEDTRRQLFEPFFTTKERGHGTGLGLATVYGAVKQNGGSIWVESERGSGTTVRIYLPAVPGVPHTPFEENTAARSLRGTETILVVDDRADVRGFVREVLQRQGYTVIEAANPRETLGLLPTVGERVKLLIVDFGLPQMDGRRLARLCRDLQPHLRVLYMSGNPPEGALAPGLTFVQKPLESRAFLETVRTALDAPANMV